MEAATVPAYDWPALPEGRSRTPRRTIEQRRDALAQANMIRSHRAAAKRELRYARDARAQAIAHILEPHPHMERMKLYELLVALPKMGPGRASLILRKAQASHAKTLGGLSDRQRDAVVEGLTA